MTFDKVTVLYKPFKGLSNITEINLSKLNASNIITEMADSFQNCLL